MKSWYVLQTKSQKEAVVVGQLRLAGYETFFPILHNCLTKKALFPSYVFVKFDAKNPNDQRVARFTRGVIRILGTQNDGPIPVPENVMSVLLARADSRGIIAQELFHRAGELVRVQKGLLKDLVGILEKPVDAKGRLHVLFKIFNHSVKAMLKVQEVSPVAAV